MIYRMSGYIWTSFKDGKIGYITLELRPLEGQKMSVFDLVTNVTSSLFIKTSYFTDNSDKRKVLEKFNSDLIVNKCRTKKNVF